jgi:ferrous iron transport protein A
MGSLIPLAMCSAGDKVMVSEVSGRPDVKKHLEDLGFTEGTQVTLVSSHNGDMIVKIKESKLAVTREMAGKIKVALGA